MFAFSCRAQLVTNHMLILKNIKCSWFCISSTITENVEAKSEPVFGKLRIDKAEPDMFAVPLGIASPAWDRFN